MHDFARPPLAVVREMVGRGVALPWTLAFSAVIGVWLMLTRLTLGTNGAMANADHLIGALVLTTTAIACAEVARPVRFLNAIFGLALLVTPFVFETSTAGSIASGVCGVALIALSLPRGAVHRAYGGWNRWIV